VPFVVPGDVVDIQITRKKKNFLEGKAVKFHHYSEKRIQPRCEHFGLCGGCKWQNLNYRDQLFYKQKQVRDNFERIGGLDVSAMREIIPSEKEYYYRNKLEFTFSNRKWLVSKEQIGDETENMNGLGFHLPGMFDRIIDLQHCYLQPEPSDSIRNTARRFAMEKDFEFYDVRAHTGFLRNLIIRTSSAGQVMVIVVFARNDEQDIRLMLEHLQKSFPQITSLMWVINTKKNDVIFDLDVHLFSGLPYIIEEMEGLRFKVGPKSFYQTNSQQAYRLYETAREFAGFQGDETVYDLYCGTGTITNFIASSVKKAVGVEIVPEAIVDARYNARFNGIKNVSFFAGDIAKLLDDGFTAQQGLPDVVIADPPRAGLHPKVVAWLLKTNPGKIVYVSCNPATQARDIDMLRQAYELQKIQPVDMFPQTHHVENVVLLTRK